MDVHAPPLMGVFFLSSARLRGRWRAALPVRVVRQYDAGRAGVPGMVGGVPGCAGGVRPEGVARRRSAPPAGLSQDRNPRAPFGDPGGRGPTVAAVSRVRGRAYDLYANMDSVPLRGWGWTTAGGRSIG